MAAASAASEAFGQVWGYTIINDVTARDLQREHKQWLLGKSLDTHCPMGPYAVTRTRSATCSTGGGDRVNGERRQHAPVKDLIFDIPELIETLSAGITLLPGDIIATGTPAGVGIGFDPPKFLTPAMWSRCPLPGSARCATASPDAGPPAQPTLTAGKIMKLNAQELAVEIDGDGPAVPLVHGLGGTTNFYQVQADALADRFKVIRVDCAGAGRSPLTDGISIESHADDLVAVLDQLGIDSAPPWPGIRWARWLSVTWPHATPAG